MEPGSVRTSQLRLVSKRVQDVKVQDEEMQELFRRFFGFPPPNAPRQPRPNRPQQPQPEEQPRGVGSGFILTGDGFIMTNAHVVDGAQQVIVTLTDKREFVARIVGSDKRTDVAVVKIDATGLPPVKLGDPNRLKVGEWVMAIGSPFGLENTVTAGIVSAKGRDTGDYLPFIQTDVAINPGNSGGFILDGFSGKGVPAGAPIGGSAGGWDFGGGVNLPVATISATCTPSNVSYSNRPLAINSSLSRWASIRFLAVE